MSDEMNDEVTRVRWGLYAKDPVTNKWINVTGPLPEGASLEEAAQKWWSEAQPYWPGPRDRRPTLRMVRTTYEVRGNI